MKKFLAALLTVSITTALAGCNKPADEQVVDNITKVTSAFAEVTETTSESISETIITITKETEEPISTFESVSNMELEINKTEKVKKDSSEAYPADKISILGTWYGVKQPRATITFGIDGSYSIAYEEIQATSNGTYTINNGLITYMFKSGNTQFDIYNACAAAVIDGDKLMIKHIDEYTEFSPYESSQSVKHYFENINTSASYVNVPNIYSKEKPVLVSSNDVHGKWICFDWYESGNIDLHNAVILDFEERSFIKGGGYVDESFILHVAGYQMDPSSIYITVYNNGIALRVLKKCSDTILTKDMLEGAVSAENTEYYESFFKDGKCYSTIRRAILSENTVENIISDYYIDGDTITFCPENDTFRYCVFDEYVYIWNENGYGIYKLKNTKGE